MKEKLEQELKQGDKVHYEYGGLIGDGEICGLANEFISRTYVVKLEVSNETYKYSHALMPEYCLNVIKGKPK